MEQVRNKTTSGRSVMGKKEALDVGRDAKWRKFSIYSSLTACLPDKCDNYIKKLDLFICCILNKLVILSY